MTDHQSSPDIAEALRLLAAEDARQAKLHELLETIREQIRLEVAPEHRPDGLFQNIQDAVYAMRGRTLLMNDAAITAPLRARSSAGTAQPTAWRVYWVSLNTSRTELFEDHAKATAKARETGGCVIPLFNGVAQQAKQRIAAPSNDQLSKLWNAIVENTKGDGFWIGEILLTTLEREVGFNPVALADTSTLGNSK